MVYHHITDIMILNLQKRKVQNLIKKFKALYLINKLYEIIN
jgi:hypothetical protein